MNTASPPATLACSDFTRDLDINLEELGLLLDLASDIKRAPLNYSQAFAGRSIALLFEKPSLRTRLTFELAARQMGGNSVAVEGPIGAREPLEDVARNLDRWVNGIVARTFSQATIDGLAQWSRVPVINALSDLYHPCQALADLLTLRERLGGFRGHKLAFVGDGNNVAHSLMLSASRLGMDFAVATPSGYTPDPGVVSQAEALAQVSGSTVTLTNDPYAALHNAHAVYTDVWASMGQESEAARRRHTFAPFQVSEELFSTARPEAVFMHCLPAHRGEEVTAGVIESPKSVVFEQAENRLHVQKALLLMLVC